jgi:hypothetical protein
MPGRSAVAFRHVVVIGGGCYGSWYTQQLSRAHANAALVVQQVTVVDQDPDCRVARRLGEGGYGALPVSVAVSPWSNWLAGWLDDVPASERAHDAIVPSPLMPHLLLDWLVSRATTRWPSRAVTVEPLRAEPDIPWQRSAPDGRHYVSFAEWMCPVNCIEPARCPATRGPRDWSMPPALSTYAAQQRAAGHPLEGPIIFHCLHRVWGVGMIDAEDVAAADHRIASAAASSSTRFLVGTVSHCHGALGVLRIA